MLGGGDGNGGGLGIGDGGSDAHTQPCAAAEHSGRGGFRAAPRPPRLSRTTGWYALNSTTPGHRMHPGYSSALSVAPPYVSPFSLAHASHSIAVRSKSPRASQPALPPATSINAGGRLGVGDGGGDGGGGGDGEGGGGDGGGGQ